jgi:hypothetical protein
MEVTLARPADASVDTLDTSHDVGAARASTRRRRKAYKIFADS